MLDSTWSKRLAVIALIALAALTAASLVYVQSQKAVVDRSYQDYQRNAADYQQRATNQAAENCRGIIARERFFECAVNQLHAYAQQDNANQDLKAQQDMAFWAKWLFYVTVVFGVAGVVLTLVGIKYVKDTLLETRRIGEAETRSYLSCAEGVLKFNGGGGLLRIKIRNTGHSPTSPIEIRCQFNFCNSKTADGAHNTTPYKTINVSPRIKGPALAGGETNEAAIPLELSEIGLHDIDLLLKNTSYVRILCYLKWTDVFGSKRATVFYLLTWRIKKTGKQNGNASLFVYNQGIIPDVIPFGQHQQLKDQ